LPARGQLPDHRRGPRGRRPGAGPLALELQAGAGVLAWADDPGNPGEPEVGDAVLGLEAGQVVVLNLDPARTELGDLGAQVRYLPGHLGLLVGGADGALGHVQVGAAAALEHDSGVALRV